MVDPDPPLPSSSSCSDFHQPSTSPVLPMHGFSTPPIQWCCATVHSCPCVRPGSKSNAKPSQNAFLWLCSNKFIFKWLNKFRSRFEPGLCTIFQYKDLSQISCFWVIVWTNMVLKKFSHQVKRAENVRTMGIGVDSESGPASVTSVRSWLSINK